MVSAVQGTMVETKPLPLGFGLEPMLICVQLGSTEGAGEAVAATAARAATTKKPLNAATITERGNFFMLFLDYCRAGFRVPGKN